MMSALMGGGGSGKADKVGKFRKGGCMKMRTRGGEGKKNQKILRTSFMEAPILGGHYQFTNTKFTRPNTQILRSISYFLSPYLAV